MVLDKSRSLDKSRDSQRTKTEDIVKKTQKPKVYFISQLSDKSTKTEKPK